MILGIGSDLIDITRIEKTLERFGERFTRRVFTEIERAETTGEPYALLGASFSFVHLVDEMRRLGKSVVLPAGSRILDTGGFKGQSREV